MRVLLQHISHSVRGWMLVLLLPVAMPCLAQKDRLPDSVSTSDDELPAMQSESSPSVQNLDSVTVQADSAVVVVDSERTASAEDTAESLPSLRRVPDSTIRRLQSEPRFAYANDPSYWKDDPPEESNGMWRWLARLLSSQLFRIFIYAILGLGLLYALYRIIAENNLRLFYRSPAKVRGAAGQAGEEEEEDVELLLQNALQAGRYREAVRYLYLKTLRLLEEKEWIQYQQKATGQDYLRQMTGHPMASDFARLHAAYERVWYGEFDIDGNLFGRLHQYFQHFYKTAGQSA